MNCSGPNVRYSADAAGDENAGPECAEARNGSARGVRYAASGEAPPSMPSAVPVEIALPVLVMSRGLSALPRITGPVVLPLIVLAISVFS